MKLTRPYVLLIIALLVTAIGPLGWAQEGDKVDMAAMMKKAQQYTQPGAKHAALERFLGSWDTLTKVTMAGADIPAEKGKAEASWLLQDRWLKIETQGTFMGKPMEYFILLGYDNFKQSYVTATVSTFDTALLTAEGDMDPSGKALISYGTLDEYLTGEHDKMVKTIWRFVADDLIVLEIYDLPIGEKNNQVIEWSFKRRQ